jgi:hypothetical protein
MNTINWEVVLDDNATAVKDFVLGDSLRNCINSLTSKEAKTELYRLEKNVGAKIGRTRARKALNRRKIAIV